MTFIEVASQKVVLICLRIKTLRCRCSVKEHLSLQQWGRFAAQQGGHQRLTPHLRVCKKWSTAPWMLNSALQQDAKDQCCLGERADILFMIYWKTGDRYNKQVYSSLFILSFCIVCIWFCASAAQAVNQKFGICDCDSCSQNHMLMCPWARHLTPSFLLICVVVHECVGVESMLGECDSSSKMNWDINVITKGMFSPFNLYKHAFLIFQVGFD